MFSRRVVTRLSSVAFGLGVLLTAAQSAGAQAATASTHWQAWIGCWQMDDPTQAYVVGVPVVCVLPAATETAVDVVTVDSGKVVSRYTVDASGRERAVDRDGCKGWEKAQWSKDSLRVFLSSELTCGATKRTSSGVMSISPGGQWVNVDAVRAGGNEAVRAARYNDVFAPAQLPQDVSLAVTLGRRMDRRTAAVVAGGRMTPAIIIEAMHALDTAAVQAWLVERHETFNLSAKMLVELADAGVPGSVTDVMVAASFPEEFHFGRAAAPSGPGLSPADSSRIASEYMYGRSNCNPMSYYSPFDWGVNPCNSYYDTYRYGYPGRYGYGYGYNTYGYGYGYTPGYYSGVYTGPVVIVTNSAPDTRGHAVKGQGYTRGGSSSSGSGSSGSAQPSSASSGSGGSSSGASSAGSSAGSSSSGGRTAIPRPPT